MDAGKLVLDQLGSRRARLGTTIAERYELIGLLAEGGMGAVYKARHILLDKTVAVKVLKVGEVDSAIHQRFTIEAKAAAALSHPNLMAVHDYGMLDDGSPFLVMEFVEGRSLAQVIKNAGGLEPSRAIALFLQICDGLSHAHSHGLIHRDVKPGNIILVRRAGSDEESAQIIDFGLVKRLFEPQTMTQTGQVFGTPLYMSPEQCAGKTLDQRSDIYSLGCVMYESLTGLPALQGETPVVTMFKHITEMPEPMNVKNPRLIIDPQIERIVFKCLEKDPVDRYNTVLEIKDELRRAQAAGNSAQTVVMPAITVAAGNVANEAEGDTVVSALGTANDTKTKSLRNSTSSFPACDDSPTLVGEPTLELPVEPREVQNQRHQLRHRYVASFAVAMVTALALVLWNAANTPILKGKDNSTPLSTSVSATPKRAHSKFGALTNPPVVGSRTEIPPTNNTTAAGSDSQPRAYAQRAMSSNGVWEADGARAGQSGRQPMYVDQMPATAPDQLAGTPVRRGAVASAEPPVVIKNEAPIANPYAHASKAKKPSLFKRIVSTIKHF